MLQDEHKLEGPLRGHFVSGPCACGLFLPLEAPAVAAVAA